MTRASSLVPAIWASRSRRWTAPSMSRKYNALVLIPCLWCEHMYISRMAPRGLGARLRSPSNKIKWMTGLRRRCSPTCSTATACPQSSSPPGYPNSAVTNPPISTRRPAPPSSRRMVDAECKPEGINGVLMEKIPSLWDPKNVRTRPFKATPTRCALPVGSHRQPRPPRRHWPAHARQFDVHTYF